MKPRFSFNVINAVRLDMSLHGGRFIIIEFFIASLINACVVIFSGIQWFTVKPSLMSTIWFLSFIGILLNCISITAIAMKISRQEGNRPLITEKFNPANLSIKFTVFILVPYLLPFVSCRQIKRNQNE